MEFEASIGSRRLLAGASVASVRNWAARDGGALHMTDSGIKLWRSIFAGNVAGEAGGAISAMQQARQTVDLAPDFW